MNGEKGRIGRDGKRYVFIGAYVPEALKRAVEDRARSEYRTVSQEVARVLAASLKEGAEQKQEATP